MFFAHANQFTSTQSGSIEYNEPYKVAGIFACMITVKSDSHHNITSFPEGHYRFILITTQNKVILADWLNIRERPYLWRPVRRIA